MKRLNILAIIPARSGSKSVPHKNIRTVAGLPLLAWSIRHARDSRLVNRVIVSTDSEKYADIARQHGAEVPFLRPAEFSGDRSTDLEVFRHALAYLRQHEGYEPEICVHLRPTYPARSGSIVDDVIQALVDDDTLDSVRTVAPAPETPYKMWHLDSQCLLHPVCATGIPDPWNSARQELPPAFLQNACVDAVRTSTIVRKGSMTGDRILGFLMNDNLDIDTETQLNSADDVLTRSSVALETPRTFCFDIDGVIAELVPNNDYGLSGPNTDVIQVINTLYDAGHRIVLYTARGSATGMDWTDVTKRQLNDWNVRYHELHFGKPAADFYVDDRMFPLSELPFLSRTVKEKLHDE